MVSVKKKKKNGLSKRWPTHGDYGYDSIDECDNTFSIVAATYYFDCIHTRERNGHGKDVNIEMGERWGQTRYLIYLRYYRDGSKRWY